MLFHGISVPVGRGKTFGRNWNRLLDTVLGSWRVSGIATFQSGYPLILTVSGAPPFAGNRPGRVPGQSATTSGDVHNRLGSPSSAVGYLNPSAFRVPFSFEFGDVPRTMPDARRHGTTNLDVTLSKAVTVTEQLSLQVRAEAYNLLNRVQFGAPGMTVNSPAFGIISSQANTPRLVQLGLKLVW